MSAPIIQAGQIPSATSEQLSPILLRCSNVPKSSCRISPRSLRRRSLICPKTRVQNHTKVCSMSRASASRRTLAGPSNAEPSSSAAIRASAPLNAPTSELSEESRKEQMKGGQVDPATLESKSSRRPHGCVHAAPRLTLFPLGIYRAREAECHLRGQVSGPPLRHLRRRPVQSCCR